MTAQHFVKQHAQRKQIAPRIERLPFDLLGRHVRHGADHPALIRDRSHGRGAEGGDVVAPSETGQAEVENLDPAVVGHHHVARLEIAMRDLFLVRRAQGIGERQRNLQEVRHRHPARQDQVVQRAPIHQLHCQEAHAVGFLGGVDGDDVRVIEGGDGAGFAIEAFETAGDAGDFRRQHLQRDVASQPQVARAIHLAHPAGAQRVDDFVPTESAPRGQWH
jgi:hypothetical protein